MLVNECFREENTDCVDKGRTYTQVFQPVISHGEVDHEHPVNQMLDDHGVLLSASPKKAGIGQLVQSAGLAATALVPFPLVKEEVMSP